MTTNRKIAFTSLVAMAMAMLPTDDYTRDVILDDERNPFTPPKPRPIVTAQHCNFPKYCARKSGHPCACDCRRCAATRYVANQVEVTPCAATGAETLATAAEPNTPAIAPEEGNK